MPRACRLAVLALTLLALGACNTPARTHRPTLYATHANVLSPEQVVLVDLHCGPFGMPAKEWTFGRTDYFAREGYVGEHSALDRIPLWVAQRVEKDQWLGVTGHTGTWRECDQMAAAGAPSASNSDYTNSGYDRGHMAPNGDFGTTDLRHDTFFFSNAVPQNPNQNRGVWGALEDRTRRLVAARGVGFVISGPLFYDPEDDPDLGALGDGLIEYFVIGDNQVAVPTHTYKIILVPKTLGSNEWEAFAFVVENTSQGNAPYDWQSYSTSVDWIEARSGLNFFSMWTGPEAAQAESRIATPPF